MLGSWLLTFFVDSTVLLCAAWLVGRTWLRRAPARREFVWRAAIGIVLIAPALQVAVGRSITVAPLLDRLVVPRAAPPPALAPSGMARDTPRADAALPAPGRVRDTRTGANRVAQVPRDTPRSEVLVSRAAAPTEGGRNAADAASTDAGRALIRGALRLWCVGALLGVLFVLWRQVRFRRRIAPRRVLRDARLLVLFDELRQSDPALARASRGVRLTGSRTLPAPAALSRGEVCVPWPRFRALDASGQRALLAHELAHVARRDPAWRWAIQLLEAVFFFQPLFRAARRELRTASELLADERAVRLTGDPAVVAGALGRVAEWVGPGANAYAVGAVDDRSALIERVGAILASPVGADVWSPWRRRAVVVTALAGVVLGLPGFSIHPERMAVLVRPDTALAPAGGDPIILDSQEVGALSTVTRDVGLATACLLAVNCAPDTNDRASADTTALDPFDSAGTSIISQETPDRPLDWRAEEVLRLGPAEEGPEAFFRIRSDASGLAADADGNIYVLDTGHYDVRVFDRQGRHLRSLGRRGEGPGEFMIPSRLFVSPDGIVAVADNNKRALVRFAPDGAELPAVPLPSNDPSGHAAGGLVVTMAEPFQTMEEALARAPRRTRLMHLPLDMWGASGAAGDSARELGSWIREQSQGVRIPACNATVSFPRPLQPSYPVAVAGERIAWVGGPEYVVNVVDSGGGRSSVRRGLPLVEATAELAARDFGSTSIELASHEMCEITGEMAVQAAGHGPMVPWITDLRVALDGGLFVERRDPADLPTRRIDVFRPDGAYVGTLPVGFPLPDVLHGPDTFLRLERDSLNVPSVVLYRIVRG